VSESTTHGPVPVLADLSFPSAEVTECPFPFYTALRREAPVFQDPSSGDFFVSRRQDIMSILQRPEIFSNAGYRADPRLVDDPRELIGLQDADLPACPLATPFNMSKSDPPEHSIKRRAAAGLVSRDRLEQAEPVMREIAAELIDEFVDDGEVEFRGQFAAPMALLTICQLAGFPRSDSDTFRSWSMSSSHGRRFMDDTGVANLRSDAVEQMRYSQRLILERHEHPRDDFLSEFIAASVERDGGLNLPYLVSELRLVLTAGNETTQRLLTNTMLLLLRHPSAMVRVRSDRSLIPQVIEESLRLEAPTQWVSRLCLADTEVGGVSVPAGSFVLLLFGSANRDESWQDPDEFDLERPDVQKYHLAFGGGLHRCLGAPIARQEARIALDVVLSRLDDIELASGSGDELRNIDSLQKRVPRALPLTFVRA
jgi:cytochrome P450